MTDQPRLERYVVCLDDDRDFLKSLEVLLPDQLESSEGPLYQCAFVLDPAGALSTLRELVAEGSVVAMIISDQQMPGVKGTEFLMQAREICPDSVRILLTGHAGIEAAITAINEHLLDRYLTKPIEDPHDFALNVKQLLQRFEMSRTIQSQAAALQEANQRLTRLDEMKTHFLRFISHELRTPLSYMSAIAMLEEQSDPGRRVELAAMVREGYERLVRFIDQGLDYIEWCGRERVDPAAESDLVEIVNAETAKLESSASSGVRVERSVPKEPRTIAMPRELAEEALRIVLDNAIKFSTSDPRVRVEVVDAPEGPTVRVTDQGRGFPPELSQSMFEPFTVMDTLHHREGSALNLARMRAMMRAHGGDASAKSPGPGRGATFTICFPAAAHGQRANDGEQRRAA
jgi:signal transduction histidine kinase